ncbi:trp operon leader peptide [Streptomyces sp. NPDC059506]|nr:trp operon leader peptide [Streptomyces sp. SCUT-3]
MFAPQTASWWWTALPAAH